MKVLYLTTPLYYVNAKPHLGHAYTSIVADCLARAHRQRGEDLFLLTGTDEHGEKIAQAAQAQGISPQAFADRTSEIFRSLWRDLRISYDHFIRTTDPSHERIVQRVLTTLHEKGALRSGKYTSWYCVPCETSWTLGDLADPTQKICPTCQRPGGEVTEENFFLHLEEHRAWLRELIRSRPDFIRPDSRRNELLALLEKELPPLCVTRPKERVAWGIEVPFSKAHVTYVWFDALLNYITALGWPDGEKFHRYWQQAGAVHLIGKDILRHHALYWPIILHALGVEPPKMVFAHGWWLVRGEKMSKSKGNIVEPRAVVEAYGLDAFRYFLLRDVPFGDDGVFSESALVQRINSDLANDLGNLVYRTLSMLERYAGGKIPASSPNPQMKEPVDRAQKGIWDAVGRLAPADALKSLWELVTSANRLVEQKAPWTLAKENRRQELESFLYQMADAVRVVAVLAWPFIPTASESTWNQLGYDTKIEREKLPEALNASIPAGQVIRKGNPLFPKVQ